MSSVDRQHLPPEGRDFQLNGVGSGKPMVAHGGRNPPFQETAEEGALLWEE